MEELKVRWGNHQIMNKWLKMFFTYLDRYFVKHHTLPTLTQVGLTAFRTNVFDEIKQGTTDAILNLIHAEREGDIIDKSLVKAIVELYESMKTVPLDPYNTDLEVPMLEATREFYTKKRQAWIVSKSTPEYLIKVEMALDDERMRVADYLNQSSEIKLLLVCDEELLEKVQMVLLEKEGSGCKALLASDKSRDLQRMFCLFSRLENGLKPMASIVENYICEIGKDIINMRQARLTTGEKDKPDDPTFVKDLISHHKKFLAIVMTGFAGHSLFQQAVTDAFVVIINKDSGAHSNAELISTFCDRVLKVGGEKMSVTEVEESLDSIAQLFSYLTDKYLFAEIYSNQLAKRLLNQRSAGDDSEKIMVAKLKVQCGPHFTSKMEGMLADLTVGMDQQREFRASMMQQVTKPDFSVQVLTTGFWPSYKCPDVILIPEMLDCLNLFCSWYENNHQERKLRWVLSLGNASVRGQFGKKTYDFQLTTLQAVALHAFNDNKLLTLDELAELLNLDESILKPVMHSLSCGKYRVIQKSPASNKINKTDKFCANARFSSNLQKIRIPMASLDPSYNKKHVDENRMYTTEACIVRIMKARKTLQHQELIAEVLSHLLFFKPNPIAIKQSIEALIEREFLERNTDNINVYNYVA